MALVLVVEDSIVSRRVLSKALHELGHQVIEAVNGLEALEVAHHQRPDCIVLDLLIPELNGFEVLENLTQEISPIPTIVITADIQKTSRQMCLDKGAIAVLNKPFVLESLQMALLEALVKKQEE